MSVLRTRQSLLKSAYRALAGTDLDVSRSWVRVGWLMTNDDVEEIKMQARRAAGFEWVAVGYSPISFFDLHAGLVAHDGQASVGVHAHRRSAAATILAAIDLGGFEHSYAERVEEEQFNMPASEVGDAAVDAILSERFGVCLEVLRRVAERFGA